MRSKLSATKFSLGVGDRRPIFRDGDDEFMPISAHVGQRNDDSRVFIKRAKSREIRERIFNGNLLTGRNMFCKEGINLRTSCALVSRLVI